jgi:hypothetical protein
MRSERERGNKKDEMDLKGKKSRIDVAVVQRENGFFVASKKRDALSTKFSR